MTKFQLNDPSLESQWRAIILFGKNSATYKFAFAKSLLELVNNETTRISLKDLSEPFSRNILKHLKQNDKQGSSSSSTFLKGCRDFIDGKMEEHQLYALTQKYGFVNVVDAFQNVNGGQIPNLFYEKNYSNGNKRIVITDDLLKLKESFHFQNFENERFKVRNAKDSDIENLVNIATQNINHFDRVHADPAIDNIKADKYVGEYVKQSVLGYADLVIVPNEPETPPDAFLTGNYQKELWDQINCNVSQMVLSAVCSTRCKGWYKKLISEMTYLFKTYDPLFYEKLDDNGFVKKGTYIPQGQEVIIIGMLNVKEIYYEHKEGVFTIQKKKTIYKDVSISTDNSLYGTVDDVYISNKLSGEDSIICKVKFLKIKL